MGNHPDVVFIASLEEPAFALPATAFLAHAMSNIAFVGRDSIPEQTKEMLQRRYGPAYMYIMGPESAVSEQVMQDLSELRSRTATFSRRSHINCRPISRVTPI